MPKLKRLSGQDVIKVFTSFGFSVIAQRGSHIKLRRMLSDGTKQTLTIPAHRELDIGTLKAIYRQALRYISEAELYPYFHSD
jgi:predicted RNA binding protein YcfA (HicA-like mRNA interferase family)